MVKIVHLRGAGLICPIFNICGGSGGAESGASVRILRNLGYFKDFGGVRSGGL